MGSCPTYVCMSILRNFVLRSMPLRSLSAWIWIATSAWFMPGAVPGLVESFIFFFTVVSVAVV